MVMASRCVPRWSCRCGGSARYGAQASANRRTDASTTPAAGNRADHSPGPGTDQVAGNGSLARIVRVRVGCRRHQQSRADHAGNSQLPSHSLPLYKLRGGHHLAADYRVEL